MVESLCNFFTYYQAGTFWFFVALPLVSWGILVQVHGEGEVHERWKAMPRIEKVATIFWALFYAIVLGGIGDLVSVILSSPHNVRAVPTLYKVLATFLNIFAVSLLYLLIISIIDRVTRRGASSQTRILRASVAVASTHLAFASVSALGGAAWIVAFALVYRSGSPWSAPHFYVIVAYCLIATALLFFALLKPEWLVKFDKYKDYIKHFDLQEKRIVRPEGLSRDTLIRLIKPDTIANPLSWFRIILATLSVLATVVPI